VSETVAAIEIVGRRAQAREDNSTALVDADTAPGIDSPTVLPAIAFPGLVARLPRPGNGVKAPRFLAGADLETPHIRRSRSITLAEGEPEDHQVFEDGRRGAGAVGELAQIPLHSRAEVDFAAGPEVCVGLARPGVD